MIKNTSKNPHHEWILGGNPSAIEAQESEGQRQLAASSQLPIEGLAEIAAELNIQIVKPSTGDPLFTDVILPKGWKVQPTDHSMWSELLDETGATRAVVFYKAAFYDRRAFIRKE